MVYVETIKERKVVKHEKLDWVDDRFWCARYFASLNAYCRIAFVCLHLILCVYKHYFCLWIMESVHANMLRCLCQGCWEREVWCCSIFSLLEWNHSKFTGRRLYYKLVSILSGDSCCCMTVTFESGAVWCFRLFLLPVFFSLIIKFFWFYREMELLQMPKNKGNLPMVQWPLFLLASKVS